MLLAGGQVERPSSVIVLRVGVDRPIVQEVFHSSHVASSGRRDDLRAVIDAGACVEIKILRRVRIVAWSSTPSTQRLLDGVNAPDALVDSTQAGTQPRAATPQLRGNGVVPVAQRVVER